jgi:vitamin B12 transporter
LRGSYTTLVARDAETGLSLRNRPGDTASLTAVWTPDAKFTLTSTLIYVGHAVEFNRDGSAIVDSDPFTLVNLAAQYKVDDHVTVFGRINNLFNPHYENPVGFDQPGFGAYAGIRVSN